MKVEVKKVDSTRREMTIETSGDLVKNKFDEAFKKIGEKAKMPGFRAGHIPRDLLEKHFSAQAHEEVLNSLLPELYRRAVSEQGLEVLNQPAVSDVKLDRTTISFKVEVEVLPEIKLGAYKGIKITYKKPSASADEIKRHIDSIKESRKIDALDDSFAKLLGYPSLAELENAVGRQIQTQKEHDERHKAETQLIEHLTKGQDFKLPQAMVEKQLDDMLRRVKLDLALKGVPKETLEEKEKSMTAELEPEARQQVKIYIILATIAKAEKLFQEENMAQRVMEFLFREADWTVTE